MLILEITSSAVITSVPTEAHGRRSCPRDVQVTTLILIPSLNTKMHLIMLEKGIFLEDLSSVQIKLKLILSTLNWTFQHSRTAEQNNRWRSRTIITARSLGIIDSSKTIDTTHCRTSGARETQSATAVSLVYSCSVEIVDARS
jgi:hypothetical protein